MSKRKREEDQCPLVNQKIKMMIAGTCQICRVSPLYNMETDKKSFKKYGKRFNIMLQKNSEKLDTSGRKTFTTEFVHLPDNGKEFILFQIFEQDDDDKDSKVETFMGLFFGSGSSGILVKHLKNVKSLNLPSFMYNGAAKMWRVLQPHFEEMFSCNFISKDLTSMTLKHLTAVWIIQAIKAEIVQHQDKIKITYSSGVANFQTHQWVTILSMRPFITKWERLVKNKTVEARDAIKMIWQDIGSKVKNLKLDLNKSILLKISAHSFVLTSQGRFKLHLEDGDVIIALLKEITRAAERY